MADPTPVPGLEYCPRHRIAYNVQLDPGCMQCMLANRDPADPWGVDITTRHPIRPDGTLEEKVRV